MKKTIKSFNIALWSILLCTGLAVSSCYDDSALQEQLKDLNEQVRDHESRLKELERLAAQQNTNISSLQTIVLAIQENDYVTNVAPIKEGDEVIGYTITFSKSGSVTIYNGKDGYAPVIGVRQAADNFWYWTVDGEWLLDSNGDKVRASAADGKDGLDGEDGKNGEDGKDGEQGPAGQPGITPLLKIVDGYWYVSYDGGKTWEDEPLGQATGDAGDSMFAEVTYDEHYVYITMADGEVLTLPRAAVGQNMIPATDLSSQGTANCYIVSEPGSYKVKAVKGNSDESVGDVATAEVLWESFGTDVTPNVGDLVKNAVYSDGYITFQTADSYSEGNAVIAAKDASGNIIWSWHIWLTDKPEGQVYYNNVGTMMDRNLGATSATPGDVGALGLLYQWGRKDPFLGSSSISSGTVAQSTITWPSAEESDSSRGTIEYATSHPTTFITYNSYNNDWCYPGDLSIDNTRWTTSETYKSIYDPCPSGWRIPDGGRNGVWSKVLGASSSFSNSSLYDSTKAGMNFSGKFGSSSIIWYPISGFRYYGDGRLYNVDIEGYYWSASPNGHLAYLLYFNSDGGVSPSYSNRRAHGHSVRCLSEGAESSAPSKPDEIDLSKDGTANSYIVSEPGSYKVKAVKGNSDESVGDVATAEVLWESFGTDVTPNVGDLVKNAVYSDGYITFQTADSYSEGNAVIAAKDASGNIIWSWHIWLTDQPEGQEYFNNAGIMMDRNLGATSASPGDVGAFGLLYQWGRKDPFLGFTIAKSTNTWPSSVISDTNNGTIEYAISHPTTFIADNHDWYYTGSSSTDNTRWTTLEKNKSIYDPCPLGWRVPDGGDNGVWPTALGSSSILNPSFSYGNEGIDFSGKFGRASTIWYPASGYLNGVDGSHDDVGSYGGYWSASLSSGAYDLYFTSSWAFMSHENYRALGQSVRCLQE